MPDHEARESILRNVLASARRLGMARSVELVAADLKALREARRGRRLPSIGLFPRATEPESGR